MERKNKVARKVEAGIETNKPRSFLKSRDFFTFFCLLNTQIMEFFFYAKNLLCSSGIGRVAGLNDVPENI